MSKPLVGYQTVMSQVLYQTGSLYDYVFAANGIFVHAENEVMQVTMPLFPIRDEKQFIRGLYKVEPSIKLPKDQKIPGNFLKWMADRSRIALPNEILFYLFWSGEEWFEDLPEQDAGPSKVTPRHDRGYIPVEIHSHNSMPAFFSSTDNRDENGLRIYGVLGHVDQPVIDFALRISIYGLYSTLPYELVFESVTGVRNASEAMNE